MCMFSACLFADDLHWGGTWSGVWSGFGTSPYTAVDSTINKTLVIFCLDYNDEIAPPYDWKANIRPVTQSNVTDYAQYGSYGTAQQPWAFNGDSGAESGHLVSLSASNLAYTRYLEAGWLFTNIIAAQNKGDLNTTVVSQVAAWTLFVSSAHLGDLMGRIQASNSTMPRTTFNNYEYSTNNYATTPGTLSMPNLLFEDAVDEALKAAQNAVLNQNWYASIFAPSWDLVTSDPAFTASYGRPAQEFLTDAPPVPEPASILLFGTVGVGVFLALRRRRATA